MGEPRRAIAVALLAASGFSAMGYQIVWTQQAAVWLGHDAAAVLAVVAAFFFGIALGGWGLGGRIARSPQPQHWFAACEAVIGMWGALLAITIEPVAAALLELTGAQPAAAWQWMMCFAGTALVLLPASAAMGATLPAMERALARWCSDGADIGWLYAGNTLGAVAGVLATTFFLVPTLGLAQSSALCALVNIMVAITAWSVFAGGERGTAPSPVVSRRPLVTLFATGLLGIGYEILAVRVLRQHSENTVYTFAMLLAIYLVGTAAGAAAYARWGAPRADREAMRANLMLALAAAIGAGIVALGAAGALRDAMHAQLGATMAVAIAAEGAMAVAAFLLPCIAMGAVFSHLAAAATASGNNLGTALAANTLGAALAPVAFGVLLLPLLGMRATLLIVAAGYAFLSFPRRATPLIAAAASLAALAAWGPSLVIVDRPPDARIARYEEGPTATVSVVEDAAGVKRLRIDNRQQEGSNATLAADGRQALLPLTLHPAPHRVLFLGLGTGVTASVAASDRTLAVDAVELLPEVVRAAREFRPAVEAGAARLNVVTADARRFVRATGNRYDVIVADNFHPARSGSALLYTEEHFAAVRERLAPGGVFCQWLPLHQLDLDTLRSIVRAFLSAYPDGVAMLATLSLETPVIGLVGGSNPVRVDAAAVRERLARLPEDPGTLGLDDLAVLGSFIAGPAALARFAANAPRNTDDRPIVAFRAPRITYAPDSQPRDRLAALLAAVEVRPGEVLDAASEREWGSRVRAYWAARDAFLEAGRHVAASNDARAMLAQVREPLLDALRRSPDFRPAYDPLLRIAVALAPDDPLTARALLGELAAIQPQRPEAAEALRRLAR